MHNKPMKLDLSDFFTDERKCSLILLDVSWQNIKNLQDHIQNLFHLNGISLLTGDGSYLPPRESIEVLRNADSLKAFKFQTPIDDQTVVEVASTKKSTKKRKNQSTELELASSTPNNAKRSRNHLDSISPTLATNEDISPKPESKKKRSRRQDEKDKIKTKQDLKNTAKARGEDISNKENTLQVEVMEQESPLLSTQNSHLASSQKEDEIAPLVPRPPQVVLRCALMELVLDTPRIFKLPRAETPIKILENILITAKPLSTPEVSEIEPVRDVAEKSEFEYQALDLETTATEKNEEESTEKQLEADEDQALDVETPIETQISKEESTEKQLEAVELNTDNVVLNSDSEDDIMVLDDSDSDVEPVSTVVGSRKTETTDVISDLLQYGVKLTNLPRRGDTLVFKLAKTKGCPTSGQTEFLAGTCSYVNRRTKVININMISYPKYLLNLLSQYKSNLDDTEEEVPVLNVNINDLIEANICVSTVD